MWLPALVSGSVCHGERGGLIVETDKIGDHEFAVFCGLDVGKARPLIGLGIGEAGAYPSSAKSVSQWFPLCERGRATAFYDSGARVGSALARWGDCYPVQPATPPTETPTTSPSQLPAQVVSPLLRSPAPGVRTERLADPQVRDAEGVDRAAPCPYAAAA
jgi:hypothetical protein